MPTYDFKCRECDHVKEFRMGIRESCEAHPQCPECTTGLMDKTFIAANYQCQFVLKGTGWTGKDLKEKRYRKKRSQMLARKQKDNHPVPKLAPNVGGERVDNWRDAKALAKERGHDVTNYDDKVRNLSKGNS